MSKLNELKTLRSSTNKSEIERGENNIDMEVGMESEENHNPNFENLNYYNGVSNKNIKNSDSGNVTKNSFNKDRDSTMNNMNMSSNSFTGGNKIKASTRIEIDANQLETDDNQFVNQISPIVDRENKDKKLNKSNDNEFSSDDKKKIFMTDYKLLNFDNKELFTFHDMIIPGGKNAKLCMINDPSNKNLRVTEIADHFKFYEPTPCIVLIGANSHRK
jgi:hypothetical protein